MHIASQLYAMNIAALAGLLVKEGEFVVDLEDEVLDGCVAHDGEVETKQLSKHCREVRKHGRHCTADHLYS